MDARVFLQQTEKLDAQIKNKMIERQQWRDMALGITANMSVDRVQSSGSQSKMADAVVRCADMESEINTLIDKLVDTKRLIISTIEQLDSPTEYNVLHMRYIQYKCIQEIADKYGKSYEWAKKICKRATVNVQRILNKNL